MLEWLIIVAVVILAAIFILCLSRPRRHAGRSVAGAGATGRRRRHADDHVACAFVQRAERRLLKKQHNAIIP